jgi:micrococcal nuclease
MRRRGLKRRQAAFLGAAVALALLIPLGRALRGGDVAGDRVYVAKVVDGDTIRVVQGTRRLTVRLIGVDAPETNHPVKGAEPFGREATDFARGMLADRTVTLEYEEGRRPDKFGRTLAYVRLDDGALFNEEIIRAGYARVFRRFPFRYKEAFLVAEREARGEGRGMWAEAVPPPGPVIGNRRSRVYHLPGQRHYDDVAEGNRVYFESEDSARGAGYRPARR